MNRITSTLCASILAFTLTLGAANTASAEDDVEFLTRVISAVADVAEASKADCAAQAAAVDAYVDSHKTELRQVGKAIDRLVKSREEQPAEKLEKGWLAMERLESTILECPDGLSVFRRVSDAIQGSPAMDVAEADLGDALALTLLTVGDSLLTYYQEEHVADDNRVFHGIYPRADEAVCGKRADTIWGDRRLAELSDVLTDRGIELCYVASTDQKSFALGVSADGQMPGCLLGDTAGEGYPKLGKLAAMKTSECIAKVSKGTAPKAEKKAPKAEEAKPNVAAEQVEAMCVEWNESVTKFGTDCSALGKRLQRQFKALDFTLADVPRYGDYRKALILCKKAVKASKSCTDDPEVKAASKAIGEL